MNSINSTNNNNQIKQDNEASTMGGLKDRIVGGAKELAGKVLGKEGLKQEGEVQNEQGHLESQVAKGHAEHQNPTAQAAAAQVPLGGPLVPEPSELQAQHDHLHHVPGADVKDRQI